MLPTFHKSGKKESCVQTRKQVYEAPQVEIIEAEIEKRFTQSNGEVGGRGSNMTWGDN